MTHTRTMTCLAALCALAAFGPALAQDAPSERVTQILADMGLDASVLDGVDAELAVPQEWLDGAADEDTLLVRLNLSEENFEDLEESFHARYPDIEIEYTRGIGIDRSLKPLLAIQTGRYLADIIIGFENDMSDYEVADGLTDLRVLPAWDAVPEEHRHAEGLFTTYQMVNWCMAYNTDRVQPDELPATWDELNTNERWRNGAIGVADRAELWLGPLATANGIEWTRDYINTLFSTTKPQLRKEAIDGLIRLNGLGEFDLAIPAADYRVRLQAEQGAPVGFHCPEPVPAWPTTIGIMQGTPRSNSAMIFVNWLISREGQVALHHADGSRPVHRDLTDIPGLLAYPDAVAGRPNAPRTPQTIETDLPATLEAWADAWTSNGGESAH